MITTKQAFICLSTAILLWGCSKDPVPSTTTNNTTNTTNNTGAAAATPNVDYSLDTTVRLNYTVMLVNGTEFSMGFGKTSSSLGGATVTVSQAGFSSTSSKIRSSR